MSTYPPDVEKYTDDYNAKLASARSSGSRERPEVMFKKGARFYKREDGVVMYAFRSSPNAEYVAKADESHREAHPKEWLDYARSQKGKK